MESYYGYVRTPLDAILLFEACRLGVLPRIQRRLSEKERQAIRSGSVFIWDEAEAGMRRWTDGKSWSASRVSGSFLTYREMEGRRAELGENDGSSSSQNQESVAPEGYRYKASGLMKQSFSVTTSTNRRLHLICYFTRDVAAANGSPLVVPSQDPRLKSITIPPGLYPDTTTMDHNYLASSPASSGSVPAGHGHFHHPRSASIPFAPGPPTNPATAQTSGPNPNPNQNPALPYGAPPIALNRGPPLPPPTVSSVQPSSHPAYLPPPPLPRNNSMPLPVIPPTRDRRHTLSNLEHESLRERNGEALRPQEIPYQKVGWNEDQRAIHILDRKLLL
uniref:ARAD1B02200p n=1 Tax=Blastobotrys adeninivorans TaxID=409370 RepID=A0A060T4T8_BLAAD